MKWFLLFFLIILLAGGFYVFFRGWKIIPRNRYVKALYIFVFIVLCFSFPIGMAGRDTFPLPLVEWILFAGSIFMLVLLYLVLALLAIDLTRVLLHCFRFFRSWPNTKVLLARRLIAGVLLLSVSAILGVGYYRFSHPVVEYLELKTDKEANGRKELNIVAVSDIHLGFTIGRKHLAKYVDLINSLKPDLIVIAGDLIDTSLRPLEEHAMHEELQRLQAPLGVYMATGNHEYISGIEASKQFIHKTGIRLLENEFAVPDSTFVISGQNDLTDPDRLTLSTILADAPMQLPVIALTHQPHDSNLQDAADSKVDFLFCGHTHKGQIWPFSKLVEKLFKIPYGYEQKEQTHIFVSSGLGLWGPPFRIGTQSEVVSIKLTFR